MTPRPELSLNALLAIPLHSKYTWAECEPVPLLECRPDLVLGEQ